MTIKRNMTASILSKSVNGEVKLDYGEVTDPEIYRDRVGISKMNP